MTTFFGDEVSAQAARRQLGQFLRMHRESLQPEQFGFVRGPRRRSPGLLRYEIAQLAAVSDTWYTWLEQGRDIHASASALDSIARALSLDEHARKHIRYLAGIPVADNEREEFDVDVHLSDLVQDMTHSACITTGAYDLLVANRTFRLLWLPTVADGDSSPNVLRLVLTSDDVRERMVDWEIEVASLVARFRFESGRQPGNARFEEIKRTLLDESEAFREMWSEARVQPTPRRTVSLEHPQLGRLTFRKVQLRVAEQPGLTLTIQRSADEQTRRAVDRLSDLVSSSDATVG
jgi:transcriptional regulator with XRE-family HTH domain